MTLIGSSSWRDPVAKWIEYEPTMTIAAEIDPEHRPRHVFDVPSADVVMVSVDAHNPDPAVELALEIQAKDRGTGIILVLSGLDDDMARQISVYAGSWSLITSRTSSDPEKFTMVVQSCARGMPVVETAVAKMLVAGRWAGADDASEEDPVYDSDSTITEKVA